MHQQKDHVRMQQHINEGIIGGAKETYQHFVDTLCYKIWSSNGLIARKICNKAHGGTSQNREHG